MMPTAKTRFDMTDWAYRCDRNYEDAGATQSVPVQPQVRNFHQDAWVPAEDWKPISDIPTALVSRRPYLDPKMEATISVGIIIIIFAIGLAAFILFGTLHFPSTTIP